MTVGKVLLSLMMCMIPQQLLIIFMCYQAAKLWVRVRLKKFSNPTLNGCNNL